MVPNSISDTGNQLSTLPLAAQKRGRDEDRPRRSNPLRVLLTLLILLLAFQLLLLSIVPAWRARYVAPRITQLPFFSPEEPAVQQPVELGPSDELPLVVAAETPVATFTPTATPHPVAALDFAISTAPGDVFWQIAYPGPARGAGLGCAYLGFWLVGSDAGNFEALDALDAELAIYDEQTIFERYGPTPIKALRGLGDPDYYELPAGSPACRNHRLARVADYAGLRFELSLRVDEILIRRFEGVLIDPDAPRLATPTHTATPSPPTATPFPQVQIGQPVNIRSGPGIGYPSFAAAGRGESYPVLGVNPQYSWWQVDYHGRTGWIYAELVNAVAVDNVGIVTNYPPPPTPIPPPPPTATPAPPTPVPTPYFPWLLTDNGLCTPNPAMTYFRGGVVNQEGQPFNGACVHVAYNGPRNTKCTGCDGSPPGEWGFAPFGNLPGKRGTTVRIYIAPCPEDPVPAGGQNPETGFGPLVAVSPVWTYTIGDSVQCTGITFQDNRFFDEDGNQIGPPAERTGRQEFAGTGSSATPVFELDAGAAQITFTNTGIAFSAALIDASNANTVQTFSLEAGATRSTTTVDIPRAGGFLLNMRADGDWTIVIEQSRLQ